MDENTMKSLFIHVVILHKKTINLITLDILDIC